MKESQHTRCACENQSAGLEFKMIGMFVTILIVPGLNASSQGNGHNYCKKCFFHVDFLLKFAHRDVMRERKNLMNRRRSTLNGHE